MTRECPRIEKPAPQAQAPDAPAELPGPSLGLSDSTDDDVEAITLHVPELKRRRRA